MGDSFLVQMNMEYYQDLANADELPEEYLLDNRSYILGTMFGGGPKSIKKVSEYMKDVLENLMIEKGSSITNRLPLVIWSEVSR